MGMEGRSGDLIGISLKEGEGEVGVELSFRKV